MCITGKKFYIFLTKQESVWVTARPMNQEGFRSPLLFSEYLGPLQGGAGEAEPMWLSREHLGSLGSSPSLG